MKSWSINKTADKAWPTGVKRLDYVSARDGLADWALIWPPDKGAAWVVCIHGHGSHGDQLYTRKDARDAWMPPFRNSGWGILTPNLRDNAWMAPRAAEDLKMLLDLIRSEFGARQFAFISGSMGGTSNLIYAVLHPEDVACAVALGAATDLATYHAWCRQHAGGIWNQIADAIEAAYGGTPDAAADIYRRHAPLRQAMRLTMPVFIGHGACDKIMPVAETRRLAGALADAPHFVYAEIPDGNHDSPCFELPQAFEWARRRMTEENNQEDI